MSEPSSDAPDAMPVATTPSSRAASPAPISPITEAPTFPVPELIEPKKRQDTAGTEDSGSNPDSVTETKRADTMDTRGRNTQRRSTIKHQELNTVPELKSGAPRRPGMPNRRSSSRYSQMTEDYFESIPALYNTLAGWFTWVLLAGFVLGPSAQQAAQQVDAGEIYNKVVTKVPLLAISIACSGVGAVGMIWLWIRWSNNYVWLIHKIFLPGFLNGLAGTMAAGVNIWAIQGGHFHFNGPAIVTISITGGSTVICFVLTVIYKLMLMSVKRQHDREKRRDEETPDGPKMKETAEEQDYEDVKNSVWNICCS